MSAQGDGMPDIERSHNEPTGEGGAVRIEIAYQDGLRGVFTRRPDGSWDQSIAGLSVTGYDPANVMRVMAASLGTREIAK